MSHKNNDRRCNDRRRSSGTHGRESGFDGEAAPPGVQSFVEAVPGATLVCDPETLAIRAVNDPATALLERDADTLTFMGFTDLGDSEETTDGEPVESAIVAVESAEGRASFEWTVETGHPDRRRVAVRARTASIAGSEWLVVGVTDVTGRERAERTGRTSRRLYEAVATTAPVALFEFDVNGALSRWNDRLMDDTGYSGDELAERALTELFADGDRVADALARVYGAGEVVTHETTLVARSGERVPYRLTVGPIVDGDDGVIGAVGVGEDWAESSLREERLAVLTRVLRHNFRNELNAITGFSERAKGRVDDPVVEQQLDRVLKTAARLLRVAETSRKVGDLLDDRPTTVSMSLSAAVEDALDSLPDDLLADATIEVEVPAGITVHVVERFPEAISEIVDNAIRHNDTASATLRIAATELPSESWAALVVDDDGPGVPAAERAVLCGEETRLEHASGLGLWYVNWIVSAADGSFDISGREARGSRIELVLRTAGREEERRTG